MEKSTAQRFVRIVDAQSSLYEAYARRHGLQGKSLSILLWLYYSPRPITQKFIADKTQSTRQVVNSTIGKWREEGYIIYTDGPQTGGREPEGADERLDRRRKFITLSPLGREWARPTMEDLRQAELAAMDSLPPADQSELVRLYQAYSDAFHLALRSDCKTGKDELTNAGNQPQATNQQQKTNQQRKKMP